MRRGFVQLLDAGLCAFAFPGCLAALRACCKLTAVHITRNHEAECWCTLAERARTDAITRMASFDRLGSIYKLVNLVHLQMRFTGLRMLRSQVVVVAAFRRAHGASASRISQLQARSRL